MIKLVYQGKNKIIKLDHPTFSQLRNQIKQNYQDLPPDYSLSYLDQDQDQICINSDEDLSILLSAKLKMNKIFIKMSFSQVVNMDSTVTEEIRPNFQVYESALKQQENKVQTRKEETESANQEFIKEQESKFVELVQQKPIIEDLPKQEPVKQQVAQLQPEHKEQQEEDSFLSESESAKSQKKVEVIHDNLLDQKTNNQDKPFVQIGQNAIQSIDVKQNLSQQSQKRLLPKQKTQQEIQGNKLTASQEYVATFFLRQQQECKKQANKQIIAPTQQLIQPSPKKVEKPNIAQLVYHNVICSNCKDDYGIIGILYQCILCDDFNLCQNCEFQVDHPHSLVQVKKAGASIKKEQLQKKYRKVIFEQKEQKKPLIPVRHYVPSISKQEADRYLKTAENYLKEGYERSRKALDDMFLKLSMSHKNPYEKGWQEFPRKKIPETIDEKAHQLMELTKISYLQAMKFAKKYQKMDIQTLLNTYYNQLKHYARIK